jgi:hypothetical protein
MDFNFLLSSYSTNYSKKDEEETRYETIPDIEKETRINLRGLGSFTE